MAAEQFSEVLDALKYKVVGLKIPYNDLRSVRGGYLGEGEPDYLK